MHWNSWDNDDHGNAFRFLEEIDAGLTEIQQEYYIENPDETFNISFNVFSKLINLIGEIREELSDELKRHEGEYYHNSKGYY